MTTAITPATDPTTLAIIVILLSVLPVDELVGDAPGDVKVEVGVDCPVLATLPGVAVPRRDISKLKNGAQLKRVTQTSSCWRRPCRCRDPRSSRIHRTDIHPPLIAKCRQERLHRRSAAFRVGAEVQTDLELNAMKALCAKTRAVSRDRRRTGAAIVRPSVKIYRKMRRSAGSESGVI